MMTRDARRYTDQQSIEGRSKCIAVLGDVVLVAETTRAVELRLSRISIEG